MKRGLPLVFLLISFTACVTVQDQRQASALKDLGTSYLMEGNTPLAIKTLLQARELNPRDARIHHELGLAYFARGLGVEAEACFKRALELDPTLTEARLNLAGLYISVERYADAIPLLEQTVADPTYKAPDRAYNNLGWCYYQMGRRNDAERAYNQALQLSPRFCHAWYNKGLLYDEDGNMAETFNIWSRAVQYCPDDPSYSLSFGILLMRLNRMEEARTYFQRVAAADPDGGLGQKAREYLQVLR